MTLKSVFSSLAMAMMLFMPSISAAVETEKRAPIDPALAAILARIEKNMSVIDTLRTEFTEEKKLAAFKNTIILKGRISLRKPGRIVLRVFEPTRYAVVITEKVVRQWDGDTGKVQEMRIDGNPVLRTVLEQMKVWFNGNYSSMVREYDIRVVQESPIVMEFIPRKGGVAGKMIKSVTIGFRGDGRCLESIHILEEGGDSSMMVFSGTELNPVLGKTEFELK